MLKVTNSKRQLRGPRSVALLIINLIALVVVPLSARPAGAVLSAVGPVDPSTAFPGWYQDANGLQVGLCDAGPPFCFATTADIVKASPDGEAFFFLADSVGFASPLNGAPIKFRAGVEAAFLGGAPLPCGPTACGDEITFSRIRFTAAAPGALVPNSTYTVTHPYGVDTFTTNAAGSIPANAGTSDIGCAPAFPDPCDFSIALRGAIGPFLTWDPADGAIPPAGFISDGATPHRVVGSPNGTNFLKLEGPGLPVGGLVETNFILQGKIIAGPRVVVSPKDLVFTPDIEVGSVSSEQTISVSNPGTADATISNIAIAGANSNDFAITGGSCGPLPFILAVGASCSVTVQFRPTGRGAREALVVVTDDAPASPHSAALNGIGATPLAAASATLIDFGNQKVATTSGALTVHLTDTGTGRLTVSDVAISGPNAADFAITSNGCSGAGSTPVSPGGTCSVSVTFAPSATGTRNATVTFTHDGPVPGSTTTVRLLGVGTRPRFAVYPTVVAFGNVRILNFSAPKTLTITNTGTADMVIIAVTVTGTGLAEFLVQFDDCTGEPVAPGASCQITLQYRPLLPVPNTGTVTIHDDAPGGPHNVQMNGTGTLR